ncbi:DUF2593 family protein [Neisseria zalophi]|uniref:DUF2593 family protein n=1 Tax=Neisseria zalophi TaxID=640030 RepID=A0A5J6PXF1_9NEIS|nr:DUF2593 family protein [Neisseria zalophi]
MKRPTFVTVLAWFLIMTSVISTATILMHPHSYTIREISFSMGIHIALCFNSAINAIAGFAMLKAKNWGRWLYVLCNTISILAEFIISPDRPMILYGIVLFICVVYFLFHSQTHCYFQTSGGVSNA